MEKPRELEDGKSIGIQNGTGAFVDGNMSNRVSEILDTLSSDFRNLILCIENADLEISEDDISEYFDVFQKGEQPRKELEEKLNGGILTTHNSKRLSLQKVNQTLNGTYKNIQILFPFQSKMKNDTYDGTFLDIASDSVVYTDQEQKKVLKVYTRYLPPEVIQRYYEIQNRCKEVYNFSIHNSKQIEGVKNISLSIDTSHQFVQAGTYFSYGIQDYIKGENINETKFRQLYDEIQEKLNVWLKYKYGVSRDVDVSSMNTKVLKQEGDTLYIIITDLGAVIQNFVDKN